MAAVNAANKCASAGWSVAVVDELPYGGTCALRGCDPKKMLRRAAEIIDAARLMHGKGIEPNDIAINWPDLVAFTQTFTDKMPGRIENGLESNGVTSLHGKARFVGEDTVEIDGEGQFQANHFLIATGAKPRTIDVPGSEHLTDSTEFMRLDALPERILFIGGGFISFEFGHIAARAGSEVCIIDRGERPLKGFDPDLVEKLVARGKEVGVQLRRRTSLKSIKKDGTDFLVTVETDSETNDLRADLVVHGAGRVPGKGGGRQLLPDAPPEAGRAARAPAALRAGLRSRRRRADGRAPSTHAGTKGGVKAGDIEHRHEGTRSGRTGGGRFEIGRLRV
jgi:glutathione reductase (NADPH)